MPCKVHFIATVCAHRIKKELYPCADEPAHVDTDGALFKKGPLERALSVLDKPAPETNSKEIVYIDYMVGWCHDCVNYMIKHPKTIHDASTRSPEALGHFWEYKRRGHRQYTSFRKMLPVKASDVHKSASGCGYDGGYALVDNEELEDNDKAQSLWCEEAALLDWVKNYKPDVVRFGDTYLKTTGSGVYMQDVWDILRKARDATIAWAKDPDAPGPCAVARWRDDVHDIAPAHGPGGPLPYVAQTIRVPPYSLARVWTRRNVGDDRVVRDIEDQNATR